MRADRQVTSIHANKERAMAVVSVVTLLVASCTVHDARVRAATPPLETQVLQDEVTECGRALGRLEAMALRVAEMMMAVVAAPTSIRIANPPSAKERVTVRIWLCQRR